MDKNEFEIWVPRLRTVALQTARRFYGNDAEADDVVQEVLMRLWTMRDKLRADGAEALACRMTRNLCVSLWRQQWRQEAPDETPEPLHRKTPDALMQEQENERLLEWAYRQLPRASARVLRLRNDGELDIPQMAALMGTTPASVSSMLYTARRQLAQLLHSYLLE